MSLRFNFDYLSGGTLFFVSKKDSKRFDCEKLHPHYFTEGYKGRISCLIRPFPSLKGREGNGREGDKNEVAYSKPQIKF